MTKFYYCEASYNHSVALQKLCCFLLRYILSTTSLSCLSDISPVPRPCGPKKENARRSGQKEGDHDHPSVDIPGTAVLTPSYKYNTLPLTKKYSREQKYVSQSFGILTEFGLNTFFVGCIKLFITNIRIRVTCPACGG